MRDSSEMQRDATAPPRSTAPPAGPAGSRCRGEERRVVDGDDLAAGEQLRDAAAGHHQDQRGDDGLHAGLDHQQAVPQAAGRAPRPARCRAPATADSRCATSPLALKLPPIMSAATAAAIATTAPTEMSRPRTAITSVMPSDTTHERRGAIQDVDEVAVQVAVAPGEREERRIERGAATSSSASVTAGQNSAWCASRFMHGALLGDQRVHGVLVGAAPAARRPWRDRAAP